MRKEQVMIAKNDEEKRSWLWRIVSSVSTIVIILIVAFFLTKMFRSNPLEGRWLDEESGMVMDVKGKTTVYVSWPEQFDDSQVKVPMEYSMDKDTKTFTLNVEDADLDAVVKKAGEDIDEAELKDAADSVATTYDYSVEDGQLTLTDREYGDQMILDRQ